MEKTFRKFLLALVLCSFLIAVPLTLAEEAPGAETQTTEEVASPPGAATFVFLLGAGAILIVGGAMLARDNFRGDSSK